MATTKPTSKAEEALQFLDDLDSFTPAAPSATGATVEQDSAMSAAPPPPGEAAEVLAFLDEITQKSSEPPKSTASIIAASTSRPPSAAPGASPALGSAARVSTDVTRSNRASPIPSARQQARNAADAAESASHQRTASQSGSGGWGWGVGGLWSTASSALQQARTVAEEQAKQLQTNEQAKKWTEGVMGYVKNANLDKLSQELKTAGISTFTEILNAVAPPIAEHEVIQVWLSHDMHGYEGVESLVYRSLAKIMEQVEGGDLVVNKGNESKPKEAPASEAERDLHAVEGYDQALKLAQANLEDMIKSHHEKPTSSRAVSQQNPTTYSSVFLRIQPYFVYLPLDAGATAENAPTKRQLHFLLHLSDPTHTLLHTQVTQGVPSEWLDIWDDNEWVEDMVVEAIRLGVEVLGQEYVVARMGWMRKSDQSTKQEEETDRKA